MGLDYEKMLQKNFSLEAEYYEKYITYLICFKNTSERVLKDVFVDINIPNETVLKNNSIFVNDEKVDDKYLYGIKIEDLPKGNGMKVKYTVIYNGEENKNISNRATIKFKDKLGEITSIYSNDVIVNIYGMQKNNDTSCFLDEIVCEEREVYCYKGESVTYITKIRNNSNNYIDEIKISFQENNGIKFEAQYIKIKNDFKQIEINEDIFIDELEPNAEIELYFNIKVLENCNSSRIQLNGSVTYKYINLSHIPVSNILVLKEYTINIRYNKEIDNLENVQVTLEAKRNVLLRQIGNSYIVGIKSTSLEKVYVSTLDIAIVKNSVIDVNNIRINGVLIRCNQIEFKEYNLIIHIDKYIENEMISLEYTMNTENINKSIKEINTIVTVIACSNFKEKSNKNNKYEVNLKEIIEDIGLKLFITANKYSVIKNDKITYISTIINDGTVPVEIIYKLNVDKGFKLENNNIRVNGHFIDNKKNKYNSITQTIFPGDGIAVEHDYIFIRGYGKKRLKSEGVIIGTYISDNIKEELKLSENIYINVEPTVVKEFINEESIDLFKEMGKVKEVVDVSTEANIIDFYILDIKRSTFSYNEIIGKKVRVRVRIKYIIEYLNEIGGERLNLYYKEGIFSETIYLPEDYMEGELDNMFIDIQNIYFKVIDKNKLVINSSIAVDTNL